MPVVAFQQKNGAINSVSLHGLIRAVGPIHTYLFDLHVGNSLLWPHGRALRFAPLPSLLQVLQHVIARNKMPHETQIQILFRQVQNTTQLQRLHAFYLCINVLTSRAQITPEDSNVATRPCTNPRFETL